jgi:hypothetical protein
MIKQRLSFGNGACGTSSIFSAIIKRVFPNLRSSFLSVEKPCNLYLPVLLDENA